MIDFRIWQIAGWTMLHYLWVGVVLGLLAAAVRLLLRSRGANVRYLAALACFGVLAIAPLPIAMVIGSRIPAPPPPNDPLIASEHTPDRTPPPARLLASEESPETVALPPVPFTPPQAPAPQPGELLQSALSRAAMGLPWLWLIGAPLTFLLTTLGLLGAERLRRQSRLVDDSPIAETCRRLAAALGISRRVGVAICDRIAAPILLGIFRPLVLLPAVALTGWDPQQLEMVLLHELAHVRRWDNLVNLVQRVVESLLFFHPLVWIVSGWVRREREHCCDEVVVARTLQPRAYAEMLVRLSERSYSPLPHGQVVSSMAERPLIGRVRRILKKEEQSMQVSRKAFVLMFAGMLALAAILGCYALLCRAEEPGQETNRGTANSSAAASRSTAENAGEPVATSPAAKALLDAWTNRQRSIHTLHFSWLHTNFGNAETVVTPAQRQFQDTSVSFDLDEKGRYRLENHGKIWQTEKSAYVPQTTTEVFDGQFRRNFVSCLAQYPFPFAFVSPARMGGGIGSETWAISFAYRPFDARIGILDPAKLKMTAERPIVDGCACIVLRQQDANDYERIVWVDPSRDFVPIRVILGAKGNGHHEVDVSYSKDAHYGWVPTSWKISETDRQGRLGWSWGSTAVSYKLNEAIPDSTFQLAYPAGTFVQNHSTKEAYILLENGEKRPVPRGVSIRENYNDLLHGRSPRFPPNVSQRGAAKAAPDGQPSLLPDQSALAAAARTQIKRFVMGTEVYQLDMGEYPTTKQGLQALRARPADIVNPNQWNGPYIEKDMPLDPWQRPYHYLYPGKHNPNVPDIWSLGPDGIDGTADDIGSWTENKAEPAKTKPAAPKAKDPSDKSLAAKPAVPPLPTASKPTAESLEKWLVGKEVVEVWFTGPNVEPMKLKDSLETKGVNTVSDKTFRFTPGEGGGVGSFIEVEMNVSPENVERLLSLQKELTPRGYPLEPGHARVWSFQCPAETRKQAEVLVPRALRELTAKIEKALPKAEVGNEPSRGSECLGAINYEVPGTLVGGKVFVYAINPMRYNWDRQTPPDQRLHLPHLGLMITAYYRPQQSGTGNDASPEHASIRKAVMKAMEPLVKLDGGADIFEAKTGVAPKASDKAGKPSAAKPQSEEKPAETISGTVVTPGGKPAAGVFVKVCSMRGQDGMHAMWSDTATDADGHFAIRAHKDENVVFWIVSKDYAPSTHIVHTNRGDLGRVILAKGVVLKGRAVDKDGKPLSGAWVNISCRRGRAEELINVFDYNGRSALSDQNGQFVMAPVSPGNYYLEASDHANDALQKNRPAHPLSAVFLDRTVTLQDNPPIQTVELRAVPTIVVKGQMTDSSGKPIKGPLPLFYESSGPSKGADFVKGPAFWYTARTEIDAHGNFTARLAKGPKLVGEMLFSIDSTCVFRTRLTKNGPWHGGDSVKLEDLDHDMTEVAIVCCKSPVVLVKPVGENGTIIADSDVNVQYVNSPYHVASTRQGDGRWRVPRIVPEEEIKVTVSAPGYKSQSEKLELLEGEVEQLDVMLKPVSTAAKEEPDRTPAKPAVLMPVAAVQPPETPSVQPERPPYVIQSDSITFADTAIDADLAVLDKHPELKAVDLGGSGPWDGPDPRQFPIKITDAGFAHIANCKKLEKLLFGVTQPHQVTDNGLKSIEGLKQLRVIRFGVEPFTSAGLSHLAGLTNLEELDLFYPYSDSSRYDNAALDPIANLKKLRVLALYGARISDAGVAKIKGLSRLEDLQLGKSHVGDASLAIIAGFTELKTLDLQSTRVTDAGMVHLKPLAKLQWLCLKDTKITDAGLAQLKGLTQLCDLYLSDGPITEAGLKSLHDALPDLHIHGGDRRRDFTALPAYTMLTDPDIRKQYGIDIQQDKRLEAISTAFESARQSAQTIDGVRDSFRKQMEEVLTAEQRAAYKHDCQRDMASMLFNDPRRAAERLGFKLSEEQTRQFERLGQENSQFAKQHPIGDTASYHVMVKFNHEIGERALKVLTAQQRTRLYEEAERIGR